MLTFFRLQESGSPPGLSSRSRCQSRYSHILYPVAATEEGSLCFPHPLLQISPSEPPRRNQERLLISTDVPGARASLQRLFGTF